MSGSGVGRGRGWLNLNKAQNVQNPISNTQSNQRPGNNTNPPLYSPPAAKNALTEDKHFSDLPNEYSDLINNMKQINLSDDGIKFNQKIKYIIENWIQACQTGNDVENSFEAIHQACLADADLASKLVFMIASRTFLSQEIQKQNIRLMFLRKLQDNFENSIHMKATNPTAFRNSILMMAEFYNKARLSNGQQFTFMATPLISYLEMLLEGAQLPDVQLFTIQFCLNGSSLKTEVPEKVAEVLNIIRLILASDEKHTKEFKVWLLLALEVASNRYGILSADTHKFYQDQLGDAAIASFQGSPGTLSVQTNHTSKTLDGFQSSVNVLQVSTTSEPSSDPNPSPQPSITSEYSTQNLNSSGFQSDSNSSQSSNINRKPSKSTSEPKPGRPILGVGARLNKSKGGEENNKWRERNNGDSWGGNRHKSESNWDTKKSHKSSSKGWEHDDRFDTDYS